MGTFGRIFGPKTAPDRNSIKFPEIAALEAPLKLDLLGFWMPQGVPFGTMLAKFGSARPSVLNANLDAFLIRFGYRFGMHFGRFLVPFSG